MTDIARHLQGRTLILLSNREPYEHVHVQGKIHVRQPPGGLVSALDPTMRRTRGVWVAWGSGSADRETSDDAGRLSVPPYDPRYTLRRVFLDEADVEGYYLGFANSALWPLSHMLIQHFEFRDEYWERYVDVNRKFAVAVADEAARVRGRPVVWIQDYHYALVASRLRALVPYAFIHLFWHIPFPPPDILRLLPVGIPETLLRGLLGNDLLEFHTERYCQNFLSCVETFLPETSVDTRLRTVMIDGRRVTIGAFPISIDSEGFERLAISEEGSERCIALRDRYCREGRLLGVSVDRVDYTKGIPRRLKALEQLWADSPEWVGRFTLLLVATPSRTHLPAYARLEKSVVDMVLDINSRLGTAFWTPIVLVSENVSAEMLAGVYRAADVCLVSSLQDGMNLVAKEFIACQVDERGVLVLSRFTGAAEEIEGAVLINPFNVDGFVAGIRDALEMGHAERSERMRSMRMQLHSYTIFDWLEAILSRCADLMDEQAVHAVGPSITGSMRSQHPPQAP